MLARQALFTYCANIPSLSLKQASYKHHYTFYYPAETLPSMWRSENVEEYH